MGVGRQDPAGSSPFLRGHLSLSISRLPPPGPPITAQASQFRHQQPISASADRSGPLCPARRLQAQVVFSRRLPVGHPWGAPFHPQGCALLLSASVCPSVRWGQAGSGQHKGLHKSALPEPVSVEVPARLATWRSARDQEGQGGLGAQVTPQNRKLPGLICQTEKWLCPSASWAPGSSDPGTHPGPQA